MLKPGKKDLEHALKLHAKSLVVESHGFWPRSTIDGESMRQAIEAGANNLEHAARRVADDASQRQEYRGAWNAAGVTCVIQNAGEEGSTPLRLLKRLAHFTYLTDVLRDHVSRAAAPGDIEVTKKQGRRLYFTGNGVPLSQEWNSVTEELAHIRLFFQLGIRMMHLTYNRRNILGDGCAEPANAGISDLGRAAIAEMNRVGVIVDVAHSGWRTSLQAAQVSSKPVVASHSGAVGVHQHIRSKPDEVIRAIADSGGYVGVCSVASFLGRRPRACARSEAFWTPGALDGKSHPSLAWTNWPMFTVGMVQRGISDTDIQKILGGNVMRVARAVFPKTV